MTKETKQAFDGRFTREMTETAEGMRKVGVMDDATYKLTMRELNRAAPEETVFPLTGSEIRALRERAKLSQAVFARYLHGCDSNRCGVGSVCIDSAGGGGWRAWS